MFIPIDARADVENSKKGKLTPAQHAQLNAFCLTEKTGIFDCLGKCEYISPISIDSINHTATITFRSGYIVICGRLVECEEGTTFTADLPVNSEETGYIVLKYDLSSFENNEFKVIQKTGELTQQDLNENPVNGVYEFVLYEYNATSSSMTLTRDLGYIKSVEQRLDELGFKSGSLALSGGNITENLFTRQGNYVIGNVDLSCSTREYAVEGVRFEDTASFTFTWEFDIVPNTGFPASSFTIPERKILIAQVSAFYEVGTATLVEGLRVEITGTKLKITGSGVNPYSGTPVAYLTILKFNCGYEAVPIE